jgi:UDP-glucose 4-epimerase
VLDEGAADPLAEFRRVNVEGTERLASTAAESGVKRLVFVSSVKVNGERTTGPAGFSEDDAPRPEDPYGVSKWEAEQALMRIGVATGLEIVRVRPPLVYGPGVRANFHSLMRWVARGLPLPLSAVSNRRSMVYVKNLTDALFHCVATPGAADRLFLVSDGEDLSTPDLIRRLGQALHTPARLVPVPPLALRLAGGLLGRRAMVCRLTESLTVETARIRNALNWRPPYAVDQALAETAEWYLRPGRQ